MDFFQKANNNLLQNSADKFLHKSWYLLTVFLLLYLSMSFNVDAASKGRLLLKYTPVNMDSKQVVIEKSIYFIIDSNIRYRVAGKEFYKFTFSNDTSINTGYLSYEFKAKRLLFIERGANNISSFIQSISFEKKVRQRLRYFGIAGPEIDVYVLKANKKYSWDIVRTIAPAPELAITKMIFSNHFFPDEIYFDGYKAVAEFIK